MKIRCSQKSVKSVPFTVWKSTEALWKRHVFTLKWKSEQAMDDETGDGEGYKSDELTKTD